MIAALVTGVGCNDSKGDCPKVNFLERSSSESGEGPRVDGHSQLLRSLTPRWFSYAMMITRDPCIDLER
jgi:hypothetical protein